MCLSGSKLSSIFCQVQLRVLHVEGCAGWEYEMGAPPGVVVDLVSAWEAVRQSSVGAIFELLVN